MMTMQVVIMVVLKMMMRWKFSDFYGDDDDDYNNNFDDDDGDDDDDDGVNENDDTHNVRHWSGNSEGTPVCWLQSDQWWSFYRGSYEVIPRGKHHQ